MADQEPASAPAAYVPGHKNEKVGEVVSAKMTKTIVVEVTRRVQHPMYKRIISKRNKFYAHDEEQSAKLGDVVRIIECRPMSKLKRWRLGEIVRKAVQVGVDPSSVDMASTQQTSGQKSLAPKAARSKGPTANTPARGRKK
jgi:small subunit ribosomal protein S17